MLDSLCFYSIFKQIENLARKIPKLLLSAKNFIQNPESVLIFVTLEQLTEMNYFTL